MSGIIPGSIVGSPPSGLYARAADQFQGIPTELLAIILCLLSIDDLITIAQVSYGFRELVTPFIVLKAEKNAGVPALHWAAMHRKHRLVEFLLVLPGFSINERHPRHGTPLKCAVVSEDFTMVHHIISLGADVGIDAWDHGSLLHLTASRGDFEATLLLLDAGLNPNTKDSNGETPLDWVVELGSWNLADLLICHGATVDHQTKETGLTILHRAVTRVIEGKEEMIWGLLKAGAPLNVTNNRELTPLGVAMRMNSFGLVNLFLCYGADEWIRDFWGYGQIEGYYKEKGRV